MLLLMIDCRVTGGSVMVDFIKVKGGSEMAVRGATVTYEEIEAEAATYQGSIIGPNRQYLSSFIILYFLFLLSFFNLGEIWPVAK